jgi:hypothetical protein
MQAQRHDPSISLVRIRSSKSAIGQVVVFVFLRKERQWFQSGNLPEYVFVGNEQSLLPTEYVVVTLKLFTSDTHIGRW